MIKIILALITIIVATLLFMTQTKKDHKIEKVTNISPVSIEEKETAHVAIEKNEVTTTSKPAIDNTVNTEVAKLSPFKPKIQPITPDDADVPTESLEELEIQAFKLIQPKINAEMLKLPECLENATTKAEAFACNSKIRELHRELAMSMGDFSEDNITGFDDAFIWNEETKVDMIKEIENSTQEMQEMQTCIDAASTEDELNKCLEPKEEIKL